MSEYQCIQCNAVFSLEVDMFEAGMRLAQPTRQC